MPAFCAHCGSRLTDEARFCTSCGRPNITPPPVAAPSVPPPLPASPPAAPGTAQAPSGSAALGTPPAAQLSERARTVLTRLLSGDWIAPARIAALPTALLILLALVVTLLSDVPGDDFGDVFFTALAVVMSAVGARPGLELMPVRDTALASAEISVVPLGVTLLWATALWFGARLHLRGAAGSGAARLNSAETALLAVRGVLSAVLGAVVLAWVAGTSIALSDSGGGWDSAAYLLGVEDPTISVTCSPVSAAWWTLLLASAVLFPTLCRTSASEWVARRPGLGAWLRAARHAGVSLAVSLAVAGIAVVVLLVSKGGSAALIPALLLAPNLATTLLGFAWGAPVRFDIEGTGISAAMDSDASGPPWTASLFQLQNLSGWVWTSVLLGVVAAVVLGAGVLREEARPVAAVRAVVSFVSGFLLAVLIAGITVELTFDAGATPWLGRLLEDVLDLPDSSGSLAAEAGLAVPGALFAAAVWGAVGAFGVPAAARRLGVTHLAYLPGLVAFVRGVNTRSGPALTTVTPVPAPTAVPVPVPPAVPVPGPVPVAVAGPVAVADPRPAAGSVPVAGPVTVAGPVAVADPGPAAGSVPVAGPGPVAAPELPVPAHAPLTDPAAEPAATPAPLAEPAPASVAPVTPPAPQQALNPAAAASEAPVADEPTDSAGTTPEPAPVAPAAMAVPAASDMPPPLTPAGWLVPAPAPQRRRIGWGVVTATLVATAVVAGGLAAGAVWLTSDRSAPRPHTAQATAEAVPSGAGTLPPAPSSGSAETTDPSSDSTGSDASPSASATSPKDIVSQVQGLLEENTPLRQQVQDAVAAARDCSEGADPVRDARDDLVAVAEAREGFVRQIDQLAPQATGDLAEALVDLSRAWTASAAADRDYASWASGVVDDVTEFGVLGCGHSGAPGASDWASAHNKQASTAKKDFAELWNSIAPQYDLTTVDPSQI